MGVVLFFCIIVLRVIIFIVLFNWIIFLFVGSLVIVDLGKMFGWFILNFICVIEFGSIYWNWLLGWVDILVIIVFDLVF